ncbi:shematrin-like protein 1 [Sabethes cyaneus]|uniref:shematrin-like protein 1 n=1 Tax=Sabethes cyaneus TaxID=53552 RepID=UPI00237EC2C1|nr:shematrin-like protein 1 [Sabethes cyaneus]
MKDVSKSAASSERVEKTPERLRNIDALFTLSTICLVSAVPVESPIPSAEIEPSANKKTEKRAIGLGYGLTGFGYDPHSYSASGYHTAGYHPIGYVAPVATTTVFKAGYAGIPTAHYGAGYGGLDAYGKYGYHGFYPGYGTGYGALGYGAVPAASSYAKVVQPATTSYSKVVQTYPHYGTAAVGYTGLAGYHGGYLY